MADESIIKVLWKKGAIRLLPALMLSSIGFGIVYPLVPTLATDYFASQDAGHTIHCEDLYQQHPNTPPNSHLHPNPHPHPHPHPLPHLHPHPNSTHHPNDTEACHNAHSTVVYWSSTTSFVSNTIIAFLIAPIIGDLSDRFGRKPFLLLGVFLSCMPLIAVTSFVYGILPFSWYYFLNAVSNINATLSSSAAYMADTLEGRQRATGFGLIVAVMFVGFSIGPVVGLSMTEKQVCGAGLMVMVLAMLYVIFCVNESLPPDAQASAQKKPLTFRSLGTFKMFKFLGRSDLFIKLAICLSILGVVQEGIQDMLIQYLQLKVNFQRLDQGMLFSILGGSNLIVQTVIVSYGVAWYGEQRLLLVGLVFFIIYQLMLAMITTKTMAFVAVGVGSLSGVTFPAISSIKANNCADDEQGMLQGALSGLRAISQGIGPLLFATLFSLFTRTDSHLPYIPGVPFYVSCVLTVAGLAVAATIHPDAGLGLEASGRRKDVAPGGEGGEDVEEALLLGADGGEQAGQDAEARKIEAAVMAAAEQIPSLEHP